jgi:hypothetical protein
MKKLIILTILKFINPSNFGLAVGRGFDELGPSGLTFSGSLRASVK